MRDLIKEFHSTRRLRSGIGRDVQAGPAEYQTITVHTGKGSTARFQLPSVPPTKRERPRRVEHG